MTIVLIITYASLLVFLLTVITRYLHIARMPLHLRWELYPVAHEKKKARYGGSYLEEPEWWNRKRESSLVGELKVMIPEILLLAGVWEHNREHWFRTFPFHFGLYLLAGLVGLLFIGGIGAAAGLQISPDGAWGGAVLHHLTYGVGYVGLILSLAGTLALIGRRIFNADYREYTKQGDYFNLLFFAATLGVTIWAQSSLDPTFQGLRSFFQHLVTLDLAPAAAGAPGLHLLQGLSIVMASLLLAYIPMTHMSHFFTKWFMYHQIRWSDEPNLRGGKFEKKIAKELQSPVSWSAPHIRGDGKKNWVDVATSDVEEDKK